MASDIISYFESRHLDNLVVINPDHPSGNYITKEDMLRLVSWTKDKGVRLVQDKSFVDFADEGDSQYLRLAVRNTEDNNELLDVLREELA